MPDTKRARLPQILFESTALPVCPLCIPVVSRVTFYGWNWGELSLGRSEENPLFMRSDYVRLISVADCKGADPNNKWRSRRKLRHNKDDAG